MQDDRRRQKDDFWDISELIPKQNRHVDFARSTQTVELREARKASPNRSVDETSAQERGTVIKRYIPPRSDGRLTEKEIYESCESYAPEESLIHRVTLKKQICAYQYYGEFLSDAIRYQDAHGTPCEFVPFFSYVPQYNQLTKEQLAFYLWFRENARERIFLKTDYSYVLLYVYELINLGAQLDVKRSQAILTDLWTAYHKQFPALAGKLADWICDFSLLHRLPPPVNGSPELAGRVVSLKEFYIAMPKGDMEGCTRSLLRFCSSYEYRNSKFYKPETKELFDVHVFGAVREAVRFFSKDGQMLSALVSEDSRMVRDAYAGALCVAKEKYRIEVEYCSFSRTNELRFLIGDVIKYAENQLRNHLGIKSRMSVYSVSAELRQRLDVYFAENLPPKRAVRSEKERQAYEVLYDTPKKAFSLSDAKKIEQDSWSTTKDLVTAFEEETEIPDMSPRELSLEPLELSNVELEAEKGGATSFGSYYSILTELLRGETGAIHQAAKEQGTLPEALADRINELAFETIGDALVEETGNGYRIMEEYRDLFE